MELRLPGWGIVLAHTHPRGGWRRGAGDRIRERGYATNDTYSPTRWGRRAGSRARAGGGGRSKPEPTGLRRTLHQAPDDPIPNPTPSPAASSPLPGLQRSRLRHLRDDLKKWVSPARLIFTDQAHPQDFGVWSFQLMPELSKRSTARPRPVSARAGGSSPAAARSAPAG
jgi:hypothetical protein